MNSSIVQSFAISPRFFSFFFFLVETGSLNKQSIDVDVWYVSFCLFGWDITNVGFGDPLIGQAQTQKIDTKSKIKSRMIR